MISTSLVSVLAGSRESEELAAAGVGTGLEITPPGAEEARQTAISATADNSDELSDAPPGQACGGRIRRRTARAVEASASGL